MEFDASGQPINPNSGSFWTGPFSKALRNWSDRFRQLNGSPPRPMRTASTGGAARPTAPPPAAPPVDPLEQLEVAYGNATPHGRRVLRSPSSGKIYDQEWLAGQIRKYEAEKGLGAQGAPATPPAASVGPPEPTQVPPEPPSAGSKSMLETTDPAVLQQILGLGDLERQLAFAEKMRDQENPSGRYVSNGRIYVAGSPLEHGVAAFQKFRGKRQADQIGKDQIAGRSRILDILKGQ